MADKNLAASANNGVAAETGTVRGTPSGAVANTNDGDTGTFWKRRGFDSAPGFEDFVEAEFTIEITFDKPAAVLNDIKYWIGWVNTFDGIGFIFTRSLSCSLFFSGAWNEIGTSTSSPITISGSWTNVSKVKIRMYTRSTQSGPLDRNLVAAAILYELEAWGTVHKDIGLRLYTGSSVVKVGCQDLDDASHKLRIRKGGTTYGIKLVATDDIQASGIRIYDGSVIKALPLVD